MKASLGTAVCIAEHAPLHGNVSRDASMCVNPPFFPCVFDMLLSLHKLSLCNPQCERSHPKYRGHTWNYSIWINHCSNEIWNSREYNSVQIWSQSIFSVIPDEMWTNFNPCRPVDTLQWCVYQNTPFASRLILNIQIGERYTSRIAVWGTQ